MSQQSQRPLVHLENVDAAIDGTTILHGITWQLDAGIHWGLVGHNGSGKSSFLRLVAGALWPAPGRGSRRYDFGRGEHRDALAAKRRITLVGHELQDQYLKRNWNFSAFDVVLSGLFRTDVPRKRPSAADAIRTRALIRQLGLTHLAQRPFLELSRGEQRRVLIARGFAFKPQVLLLDEPAGGLDAQARRDLEEMLARIAMHSTLVCAAHTQADLPAIVSRVAELRSGKVVCMTTLEPDRRASVAVTAAPFEHVGYDVADDGGTRDTPLIEVDGADVWLGGRRALQALDWRLLPGQQWLVRGANGAGKSTFLRLLHGQLRPALGGSIRWPALGNPRSIWQLRRRIAWVSPELQAAYLYPATVRQCIASGFTASIGQTRRATGEEIERIEQLLDAFDLRSLASRSLKDLSYGQRHRALIARAFANRPKILLLDEPWEGLDPASTESLCDQLQGFAADGGQWVCVSHVGTDLEFSHELLLENGRIVHVERRAVARKRASG